jgi:ABC-type multidrug transport system fused ATPase/permease subunit
MSSVLAEFLQQFFTFIFTAVLVVILGGQLAWVLLLFVPFIIFSAVRIGRRVRSTTRRGQDQLADVQNILHETITGNRIVKAFGMESWEVARFRSAAQRLFHANLRSVAAAAISSRCCYYSAAAASHTMNSLWVPLSPLSRPSSPFTIRCASLPFSITAFSRRWARHPNFSSLWMPKTWSSRSPAPRAFRGFPRGFNSKACASPIRPMATIRAKSCGVSTWM